MTRFVLVFIALWAKPCTEGPLPEEPKPKKAMVTTQAIAYDASGEDFVKRIHRMSFR